MPDLLDEFSDVYLGWAAAVDAAKAGDQKAVAYALFPDELARVDADAFARITALTLLGAILAGGALRRANPVPCPCGDPTHVPALLYAHPSSGRAVDPVVAPPVMASLALAVVAANESRDGDDYLTLRRYVTARVRPATSSHDVLQQCRTVRALLDLYVHYEPAGTEPSDG